jgi:uncharacterized protein with HEPN domain
MLNKESRDLFRVQDILKAISLINSFVDKTDFPTFSKSELIQSAVIHQFQIIGEACDKISDETKSTFTNIEWRAIKSFRNFLIHEYFKVDVGEVWATIENDLKGLEEQMEDILSWLQQNKK